MNIRRKYFLFLLPLLLLMLAGVAPARLLRVGIYDNPPLSFVDEDGGAQGFVVDVLREIAQEENLELEFVFCEWDECLRALEAGEIDLLVPIAFSEERLKRFDFSAETLITNWGQVYVQSDALDTSILDMEGKTIAAVKEDIHTKELQSLLLRFGFSVDFIYVDSYAEVLQKVEKKEVFGGIVNHLFAMQHAADYGVIQSSIIYNPIEVRFATAKGEQPEALLAIDQQLASMKADKSSSYYQALNFWFDAPVENIMPIWAKWLSVVFVIVLMVLAGGTLGLRAEVRKRTADLREAEAKYRNLVDNSLVGIYITQNHRLQFANEGLAKLFGYPSAKDMLGVHVQKLVTSQTWGIVQEEVELRVSGKKKTSNYRFKGLRKDGSTIDIEALGVLTEYQGEPAIQGVLIDITERVRAEERFKHLSEASLEAIFISEKGICLEANLASEKLFGYSQEEAVGMTATDIVSLEDRDLVIHHILSGYDEPYRVTALRKDGTTFPAEINGRMMRYEGRAVRVTSIRDITKQVQADVALRESEARYQAVIKALPDLLYRFNLEGIITFANYAYAEFNGIALEQIIGTHHLNYVPTKSHEAVKAQIEQLCTETPLLFNENENIDAEGNAHWFRWANQAIFDNNGQVVEYQAIGHDITEQVQAARYLKESEEKLNAIIAQATEGITVADIDGNYVLVNPAFCKMSGYSEEELLKLTVFDMKAKNQSHTTFYESKEEKAGIPMLVNLQRKDKSEYLTEITETIIKIGNEELVLGTIRDISERLKIENTLRESEERYRLFFENNDAIIILIDPNNGEIVFANDAALVFYGYTKEEFLGMKVNKINILSPEKIETTMAEARKRKQNQFTFKHMLASGEIRDVEVYQTKLQLNQRELFSLIVHDITDRKEAEEKLRKSKERFENVVAQAPIPMAIALSNGDTEFVNHKFTETFGYTHKDIAQAEQWWNTIYPDKEYRDFVKKKWQEEKAKAEETGAQIQTQARKVTCKDGTIRNVEFDMMSLGDISIITMNDITEFTNAQRELKLNVDQLIGQNRISTALATSLNLENLLEIILKEAALAIQFDAAAVFLKEENGAVTVAKATGEAHTLTGEIFSLEETALEHVGLTPLILDDAETSPLFPKWDNVDTRIRGWMALPLIARDLVLGYLTFDSYEPRAFSPEDAALAESFAPHIAQAIYNANLYARVIQDSNAMEKHVQERTEELQKIVNLTANREIRMAELKRVIAKLRTQLIEADQVPIADDPLRHPKK